MTTGCGVIYKLVVIPLGQIHLGEKVARACKAEAKFSVRAMRPYKS